MDIVPIIKKKSGCDYHRLHLPFQYMGIDFDKLNTAKVIDLLSNAKVVIFNRTPGFDLDKLLLFRRKFGFKIVVDLDDYWLLPTNSIYYNSWKKLGYTQKIMEAMMNADYVFCTHSRLAEKIEFYNKNVEVVPNAIPFDDYESQFTSKHVDAHIPRIIYAGGASHYFDLHSIRHVFDKLSRTTGFQMQLAGYTTANQSTQKYWDSVEKMITANGRITNYERKPMLPLEEYMNHYTSADVSLAPLEDNYFNTMKSNLKILEAGCKYIPIIVSNQQPYLDDGEVVSKASSVKEWYTHLYRYIKNPSLIKEDGYKLGEYVRANYQLAKSNEIRQQVFNYLKS